MAIGMNPRKKGLFGRPFEVPGTPGIGDGDPRLPQNDPAPGLGMRAAPQEQKKPGFFDAGGGSQYVFAGLQDFLQRRMGERPTGVTNLMQQQAQEQQAMAQNAADLRKRSLDWADTKREIDYRAQNAGPAAPNLREDNAGNVWQFDPKTGMPMGEKPVWVDPTEKVIYQDGMQIRVPNPYRSDGGNSTPSIAPGTVDGGYRFKGGDPADQSNWEPVNGGGPTQPASGGFRR